MFDNNKQLIGLIPEHDHYSDKLELYRRLQGNMVSSLDDYIEEINRYAFASSFWFDSGIGPLNEYAYRKFWRDITESSEKMKSYPILSDPTNISYYAFSSDGYLKLNLEVRNIDNYDGWKIIGDFIVAKENEKGDLIIFKSWQKHQWQYKDMILYKNEPSYH